MKPTMEILAGLQKNSTENADEIFTRLFRYLLRPDIYFTAYKNLYANSGAGTRGINDDTADGFGEEKIQKIIESLRSESYRPNPVRRTYIQKKNSKKCRPLGIPTFSDKLVQEALRMILEAIYEPIFLNESHGFRPNRSCHTALKTIKRQFGGARWFVEGDIKGCFDNIDHEILIKILRNKVRDARIIKLIYRFLKAGYLENWQYHKTYSGTPQGGILSPLLANIYLHELDKFVMKLKEDFDKPQKDNITPEYREKHNELKRLSDRLKKVSGEERTQLLEEYKIKRKKLMTIPCTAQTDKKLRYIRYFYESQQIKRRIESYKYQMSHRPTARIIRTTAEKFQQSQGLTNWADRENMKAASKALNEMTASNSTLEELESAALTAFSQRMAAKSEQSALRKKWDEIQELLPLVEEVIKYTDIHKRYKSLMGKEQTKFGKQCAYELSEYDRLFAKIREIIPEGKVPSPELLRKQLEKIQEQYNEQSAKYDTAKKEADRLAQQIQKKRQSQKTLDRYLQNEQAAKRKKGQLE